MLAFSPLMLLAFAGPHTVWEQLALCVFNLKYYSVKWCSFTNYGHNFSFFIMQDEHEQGYLTRQHANCLLQYADKEHYSKFKTQVSCALVARYCCCETAFQLSHTIPILLFSEALGWLQALLPDNVRSRIVYHFKVPFFPPSNPNFESSHCFAWTWAGKMVANK